MRRTLLLSAFLLAGLRAQEVPPPFEDKPPAQVETGDDGDEAGFETGAPRLIQVQVEWIEMPHESLSNLLFDRKPKSADATPLRREVQELVKAGTAKILETQLVTGRSGEKSTVESYQEYIYPTEWVASLPAAKPAGKEGAAAGSEGGGNFGSPIPGSFEVRNVGSTLEVEPTADETGKIIDLRSVPDLSWRTGKTVWQERKDELGNVTKMEAPEFYTIRATTALTLKDGTYALAAVLSPKDQDGRTDMTRKVMLFVKADTLDVR